MNIFTTLTIKLEKNILLDNITFSFRLASLYFGSLMKKLAKNINNVTIKLMVPFSPAPIPFPINAKPITAIIGISFAILAHIIAKLNGDILYPIFTIDTINVTIYKIIYFFEITLANIFFLPFSSFVFSVSVMF